jgi:hypothetical protein
MTASFYNNKAVMAGIDSHHVQTLPTNSSELVTGHREEDAPYLVGVIHSWYGGDDKKRTPNVTADGEKMIRDGFSVGLVPHQFLTAAIHPYELVEQAKIIKDSKTTPFIKMETVTSSGDPLSVCAVGPIGANLNCQEGGEMKLTGVVICPCSVVTSPSIKDLIFRIFDDHLKKWLIDKIIEIIDIILKKRGIPSIPRAIIKWLLRKIVPPIVDWMEDLAKWVWDQTESKSKDALRLDPKQESPKEYPWFRPSD